MSILDEMADLGFMLLSVPEGRELEKIEELKRNRVVEYAEPNCMAKIANTTVAEPIYDPPPTAVIPDDPYLPSQWNLAQIEAFTAWDITTGSDRVVIAIVDSGVDLEHPELKDKIWTNDDPPGDADGDGNPDDDQNGYVDDVHGWNFVNPKSKPQDDYGSGTFVAGIIAAEANNGILMAGVSWGAEIMPIKVVDSGGGSDLWNLTGGIRYAANNGAKIIHVSPFLYGGVDPWPLQDVINYAHDRGILIVAGSGDPLSDDLPPDAYRYPAALDHVVSVAATDRYDERPDWSTYNDMVDVAAPGVSIFSFWPGGHGWWSSTGLAAAHVSSLAALIWSVNPNLTPDQVEDIIKSTAVDLGELGRDDYFGYGRIDAAAAVMATTHYLEVEPANVVDLGRVCDHGVLPSEVITNPNTNASTWRAVPTDDWLSISGPEGLTPSLATVSIDSSHLQGYGPYTAGITAISIMTNYEHSPIIIPVTAVYTHCWESYLPLLFKDYAQ
jgi:subtilisin family serine protease